MWYQILANGCLEELKYSSGTGQLGFTLCPLVVFHHSPLLEGPFSVSVFQHYVTSIRLICAHCTLEELVVRRAQVAYYTLRFNCPPWATSSASFLLPVPAQLALPIPPFGRDLSGAPVPFLYPVPSWFYPDLGLLPPQVFYHP